MSSPLSYLDKVSLIEKANALMFTLQDPSIQNFAPHIHLFRDLSDGLQRAAQVLETSNDEAISTVIAPTPATDQRLSMQPNIVSKPHDRARKLASSALLAALDMAYDLQEIATSMVCLPHIDCQPRPQEVHIQNIFALQKLRPSKNNILRDKMLLLCACQSLSADFRQFELRNGWTPKRDELVRRILAGEEPQVQKMGKTLKNYVSSLRTSAASGRLKFYEAIRLGLKLEVLEAIGASAGLGDCISFLLGFECVKLSRMSYSSLACLSSVLCDEILRSKIARCVSSLMPWWSKIRAQYDQLCRAPTARRSLGDSFPQRTLALPVSDASSQELQSRLPLALEAGQGLLPSQMHCQNPQSSGTECLQSLPVNMFRTWPELGLSGLDDIHDLYGAVHDGDLLSPLGSTRGHNSYLRQTDPANNNAGSTQSLVSAFYGVQECSATED